MFDFFLLCLGLAVFTLPAVLFVAGCSELSRWYWSRVDARRSAETFRADLYRVAEYVGLHRANHCGCPNCGGSYSEYIESLNEGGGDVG